MSTNAQKHVLGPFFSGGVLLSGIKLYHYEAGSVGFTSPKHIWEDRSKSIQLLNPYQGDANGVLSFFADGLYKLVVARSTSTGPTSDVLYTWDNFSILDTIQSVFEEGEVVTAASTINVGPGIWTHIIGTSPISLISGSPPFQWLAFDADVVLFSSASLVLPGARNRTFKTGDIAFFLNEGSNVWRLAGHFQGEGAYNGRQGSSYAATATLSVPADGDFVDIGGADSDITAVAPMPAGYHFMVRFTGSGMQLIHSTSLICPNGDDYRLMTNELAEFRSLGSGVWIVSYRSGPTHAPADFKFKFSRTADDGYVLPIGTALVASRYRALAKQCIPFATELGTTGTSVGTVTFDNATDTWARVAHGLINGDIVQVTNAGGVIPNGFMADTIYYVVNGTADTFKLSLTRGGAVVDGTTNGTGTHTVHNKFQLPDVRGRALIPLDNLGGSNANVITVASIQGANASALGATFGRQTSDIGVGFTIGAGTTWSNSTTPPSMAIGVQIRW